MIIDFQLESLKSLVEGRVGKYADPRTVLGTIGELIVLKYIALCGYKCNLSGDVYDHEKDITFIDSFGLLNTVEVKCSYVLSSYKAFCESWKHKPKLTNCDLVFFVSAPNSLNPGFDRSTEGNIYLFRHGFAYSKHYHSNDHLCSNPKILIPYEQPRCQVVAKVSESVIQYMSHFNTRKKL